MDIIKGFLPWILYSVISGSGFIRDESAALVALVATILCSFKLLKKGFVLEWGTLLYFAALAISYIFPARHFIAAHTNIFSNGALALIMWISILIRKPFTLQYAREMVPKQFWSKPGFIFVNDMISLMWAAAITISAFTPTWFLIPAFVIPTWFTKRFPNWYTRYKTSKNTYLQGNYKPIQTEIAIDHLPIEGKIPNELTGAYLRNGPNPAFPPLTYTYPLDGDGMIHAVYIQNGEARYKNRFVETEGLLKERKAGKSLYAGIARGETKDGAFIHVIRHANHYLAMYEAGPAYEISAELETLGKWCPKNGTRPFPINAHTKLDPSTGELFAMSYDDKPPYLRYYRLSPTGELLQNTPVEKPYFSMMHDFALTENYIIFFDCPAVLDDAKTGLAWKPELGVNVIVVNRKTGTVLTLKTETFFTYHFANAFEQNGKILVDYVRHEKLSLGEEIQAKDHALPTLYRTMIDLATHTITHQQLDPHGGEFPRINDQFTTKPYRFIYLRTSTNAMMKYDIETNRAVLHEFGSDADVGEATFIPTASGEDDGYVCLFVYAHAQDQSYFVLLDAKNIAAAPIARIKLPQRVPNGLHGSWFS